jgi:hypothetical protein
MIILSDRDPIFSSKFQTELSSYLGTKLSHKSSYHPRSNGKNENVNKFL